VLFHAEFGAAVLDELVPFLEGALVEQQAEPLSGRQLALEVLLLYPVLAPPSSADRLVCSSRAMISRFIGF
jgi:hypothetical protein